MAHLILQICCKLRKSWQHFFSVYDSTAKVAKKQRSSSSTATIAETSRPHVTLDDINAVFGSPTALDLDPSSQEPIIVSDTKEAKAAVKTQVDWSLDPPAMIRIDSVGFTEIAKMESIPDSAFQIAVFANGDRIESCYIFEIHF